MGILHLLKLRPPQPPDPPTDTSELLADSRERLAQTHNDVALPLRRIARENHIAAAIIGQIRGMPSDPG